MNDQTILSIIPKKYHDAHLKGFLDLACLYQISKYVEKKAYVQAPALNQSTERAISIIIVAKNNSLK